MRPKDATFRDRLIAATRSPLIVIWCVLSALSMPPFAPSLCAQCLDYRDYLSITGDALTQGLEPGALGIDGNYAYAAAEGQTDWLLAVYDISDRLHPVFLSANNSLSNFADLSVVPGRVCVLTFAAYFGAALEAAFDTHLLVYDTSNPVAPYQCADIYIEGEPGGQKANACRAQGDFVYIASLDYSGSAGRLHVIQVGSNCTTQQVGQAPFAVGSSEDAAPGIDVDGSIAVVRVQDRVHFFDISSPTSPSLLSSLSMPGTSNGVELFQNRAYVLDAFGVIQIVDISNPSSPVLRGQIPGAVTSAVATESLLYLHGLSVYDVSDPDAPERVWALGPMGQVKVDGGFVFGTFTPFKGSGHLFSVDLSRTSNPPTHPVYGAGYDCLDVKVADGFSYVAAGASGLRRFRINDLNSVVEAGGALLPGIVTGVATRGQDVLVATGIGGLRVLRFDAFGNAMTVGVLPVNGTVLDVCVEGNLALIAIEDQGLGLVDVADPSNPTLLALLGTVPYPVRVVMDGNLAAVSTSPHRVFLVDTSNPSFPTILSYVDVGGVTIFDDIALSGARLYATRSVPGQLRIYDVSNPSLPALLSLIEPHYYGGALAVEDGIAYVGAVDWMFLLDVTNPSEPVRLGQLQLPNPPTTSPLAASLSDDAVHAALGTAGCAVLSRQCSVSSASVPTPVHSTLIAWPSPSRAVQQLSWTGALHHPSAIELISLDGRRILQWNVPAGEPARLAWDGRDVFGRRVPGGSYWLRLLQGSAVTQTRVVRLP